MQNINNSTLSPNISISNTMHDIMLSEGEILGLFIIVKYIVI